MNKEFNLSLTISLKIAKSVGSNPTPGNKKLRRGSPMAEASSETQIITRNLAYVLIAESMLTSQLSRVQVQFLSPTMLTITWE